MTSFVTAADRSPPFASEVDLDEMAKPWLRVRPGCMYVFARSVSFHCSVECVAAIGVMKVCEYV
eukprot:1350842-Amorphochlora_amoeboformis.AAC.1